MVDRLYRVNGALAYLLLLKLIQQFDQRLMSFGNPFNPGWRILNGFSNSVFPAARDQLDLPTISIAPE